MYLFSSRLLNDSKNERFGVGMRHKLVLLLRSRRSCRCGLNPASLTWGVACAVVAKSRRLDAFLHCNLGDANACGLLRVFGFILTCILSYGCLPWKQLPNSPASAKTSYFSFYSFCLWRGLFCILILVLHLVWNKSLNVQKSSWDRTNKDSRLFLLFCLCKCWKSVTLCLGSGFCSSESLSF